MSNDPLHPPAVYLPDPDSLVSKAMLWERFGIKWSNRELLAKEKRGEFPKRFAIGDRTSVYMEREIRQWIHDKHAAGEQALLTIPPQLERDPRKRKSAKKGNR